MEVHSPRPQELWDKEGSWHILPARRRLSAPGGGVEAWVNQQLQRWSHASGLGRLFCPSMSMARPDCPSHLKRVKPASNSICSH